MHPAEHAEHYPDKPAVIMARTGEVVTYRDLDTNSNRAAHVFRAAGCQIGDVVAILLGNGPRFHEIA
jgi:acyl-CoA synthetase (AMP-forming)/AMP-acid ligase II